MKLAESENSLVNLTESEILIIFFYFLAASAAKNCEKKAVIQSAASAASAKGGCAGSRLDHGLKFKVIRGGCASSRLISGFSDCGYLLLHFLEAIQRPDEIFWALNIRVPLLLPGPILRRRCVGQG